MLIARRWRISLSQGWIPWLLSKTEWSVLKLYTHKHKKMGSAGSICIYLCTYMYIGMSQDNQRNRLSTWRDMGGPQMGSNRKELKGRKGVGKWYNSISTKNILRIIDFNDLRGHFSSFWVFLDYSIFDIIFIGQSYVKMVPSSCYCHCQFWEQSFETESSWQRGVIFLKVRKGQGNETAQCIKVQSKLLSWIWSVGFKWWKKREEPCGLSSRVCCGTSMCTHTT